MDNNIDKDTTINDEKEIKPEKPQKHYCYIVMNETRRNTYVGYTVTPNKRIRQHNGEIKGGAKYTSRYGPNWSFVLVLTCIAFDNHLALSLEWHMKPHGIKWNVKETSSDLVQKRIDLLIKALKHPNFCNIQETIHVYVEDKHIERFSMALMQFPNISITSDFNSLLS